jgi:hypothetical protein
LERRGEGEQFVLDSSDIPIELIEHRVWLWEPR